jgi:hypothetical protein
MKANLDELLHRWREGTLSNDEMRQLTEALATSEARAALRRDWFLEEALPEALKTAPLLEVVPPDFTPSKPGREAWAAVRWLRLEWAALGAAAAISIACILWERTAATADDTEVMVAQLTASALEP